MSKGLGRIQRECLRVIDAYEVVGREPTTYNIVAKVYQVKRNERGVLVINEAQHSAVKRALANLRRRGLIVGMQDVGVTDDGKRYLYRQGAGSRVERCCIWSLVRGEGQEAPPAPTDPPQKSDAVIAFEIGVSRSTLRRARAAQRTGAMQT
jgi:hypothetical protein